MHELNHLFCSRTPERRNHSLIFSIRLDVPKHHSGIAEGECLKEVLHILGRTHTTFR